MKFAIIGFVILILAGATVAGLGYSGIVKIPGITPKKAATKRSQPAAETSSNKLAKPATKVAAKPKPSPKSSSKPATGRPDPDAEKKLDRLAAMYEQLPADEAGPIFAKLPDTLVEKLLRKMEDRQAAKVLLTLGTDRAAKLTLALAK